jgi:glycosyltransferase involved in cell wall biosynthesis
MKPTMIFLMNSIDIQRGGLTRASLKQASFFAEMGYETYMLTFNYNNKYPFIRENLYNSNKVHKKVQILNMYEELEGIEKPLLLDRSSLKFSMNELSEGLPYDQRKGYNAYRVYNNGQYIKYIAFNKDGSLDFIDYFNEHRYRTKREIYDPWGKVKKIEYMDFITNKPRQTIFYDDEGKAYLSQWSNPQENKVERIILFNRNSLKIKKVYVNDSLSLKVDWLSKVLDRINNDRIIVVTDTRSTDEVLIKLKHPKAAKIWRLHSSHLKAPYTDDSEISPKVRPGLENLSEFDIALLLTEEQKSDLIDKFGTIENLMVVPHYHEISNNFLKDIFKRIKRDEKLAVIVSRLSTLKQVDHSVKAFAKVVKEIPDAKLEIWGQGTEEKAIEQLIKNLKLENNVFLKGYTMNPDEIYKKGLFSILTSKSEGFSLSVLESMSNKTPVISYRTKYGPTDMIVDGENGFLIEKNDITELANKMIYLFNNPEVAKQFGENAKQYIDSHFNKNIYKEKWLEAVDAALERKFNH